MTSQDFIEREFQNADGREKTHSSIYKDGNGQIYSYGTHYPLLFTVEGRTFVNTAGYSNTTAKHISWAWSAVNYDAVAVELDYNARGVIASSYAPESEKLSEVVRCLRKKRQSIVNEMTSKKRQDTQVYKWLEHDLNKVCSSLATVESVYA
jgi:hypothetical protein